LKHWHIQLRGETVGTLSCPQCLPDSLDYVLRTEEGKLIGIFTGAPGLVIVESESQPKEEAI